MWTAFTNRVRKAFTEAADQYDILTSLHKEIGRELVKKTVRLQAQRILDVGCGTGYTTNKTKFFFPESAVVGMDIAEGMLVKAGHTHEGIAIDWVQADAQTLPFKDGSFDLMLSNLAYQWVKDLDAAFAQAHRVLADKGVLNITLFGERTCAELFSSLKAFHPGLDLGHLPAAEKVKAALGQAGFKDIRVDHELIKVEFKDLRELLGWLKNIGANSIPTDKVFLGKRMLANVDAHYREHFPYNEGICASFEVIWAYAHK